MSTTPPSAPAGGSERHAPRRASGPGRAELVALVALLASVSPASVDALLPALHAMGQELRVQDARDLQLVVTVFVAGMVLGELVFGPLSDAVGRKRAILGGLSIHVAGTLVAVQAESLLQLLIGRAIQGVGAAGPKIATRALVRDLYSGDEMARILCFVLSIMILVPMVAPMLGQGMLDVAGWRGIFAGYLALATVAAVWLAWRQPETLPARRRIALDAAVLATNAVAIVRHRRVLALAVAAGAVYGPTVLFVATSPAIFLDVYGVSRRFPLYFAILALAVGVAALANGRLVRRFGSARLSRWALVAMLVLSAVFGVGSAGTAGMPPLWFFMACCFGIFGCLGMLLGNLNAMAMESLGRVAGLGASLVASCSSAVAVALAVLVGRLHDGTVLALNVGFTLGATLALICTAYAGRHVIVPVD